MMKPPPKIQRQYFQRTTSNYNQSYHQPSRKLLQSKWLFYSSQWKPHYPPRRYQCPFFNRSMNFTKRNTKPNPKKNMNPRRAPPSPRVHDLHVSSTICYYCGASGHVNYVCPLRKRVDGLKAIWIRKDLLKSLTDHSGLKRIWVPRVNP